MTDVSTWKAKSVMRITLPSGVDVDIRIPNLANILMSGELPNNLREIALAELSGKTKTELTEDHLRANAQFVRHLVIATVVNPKLEDADLDDLPQSDIDVLAAIANREVDPKELLANAE